MKLLLRERAPVVILALYLLLAILYSLVTPIFEAGDEIWHYPFVQYIATTGNLPVQDPLNKGLWEQEGGQPPLYYAVDALATFWIDTRDLRERLWLNPHAQIGVPLAFGNKNMIVHTSAENFPWRDTTLAVHMIRFISILFGAIAVVCTYLAAREFFPSPAKTGERQSPNLGSPKRSEGDEVKGGIGVFAASFVAFNPMFLFIMASVNNDSLAVALASLALLFIIQLVTRGATARRYFGLGVALGLGALTKESTLGLCLVFAVVAAYVFWRGQAQRVASTVWREILRAAITPALVLFIAAWWYIRNWQLYGDPTGLNVWLQIAGPRPDPIGLLDLVGEFQGFLISFWGNFGGVNIIAPNWVYMMLDAFALLALGGLAFGVARKRLPPLLLIPALWVGIEFALLIRWTLQTFASQGRLMFPALSALAILLAFGLAQFRFRVLRRLPHAFAFCLFTFSVLAPFVLIPPEYRLPARLSADAPVPNPVHINFENQAELVGYALPEKSIQPNSELPITLYWRALGPMDEDYSVYLHLFDSDGNELGKWDAFPGRGLYPTRLWNPNEIVVDEYRVPLAFGVKGPQVARVEAGLYRKIGLVNLTARDPSGNPITPTIARFKIAGVENPAGTASSINLGAPKMTFGNQIALANAAVQVDSSLTVSVTWRALRIPDADYTVFVHLLDVHDQTVAQVDTQPQNNSYPTSFWDAGEVVTDTYRLNAPAGVYHLELGWYDASGARLPNDLGGDVFIIENVRVP